MSLKNENSNTSHDVGHVERVKRLAIYLAKKEGADVEVVEKAAELHDIARDMENHSIEGAKIAREILKSNKYDDNFIERVTHCIESHAFSSGIKPQTLEAKILSDADKLDAMGAIGVARTFLYSKETARGIKETIEHFEEKLLRLYGLLHTETARKIGKERHRFLKEFYDRIKNELDFKDLEGS